MARIVNAYCLLIGAVSILGLWSYPPSTQAAFHDAAIQLTGVIAIGAMCIAALISVRPRWLEPYFDGLDKLYVLHKWLGITALVTGAFHWFLAKGIHILSSGRPPQAANIAGTVVHAPRTGGTLAIFSGQIGVAHFVGEWGFYIATLLIIIALWKVVPYRLFAKSHMFITIIFIALLYHSIVLMRPVYWTGPIVWLMIPLYIVGIISAMVILSRRLLGTRKVSGKVEKQIYYPELHVLETHVRVEDGWPGHRAGQFAFVTTNKAEGAHPFTIASAWHPAARRLVFIAKELGDYTKRLQKEFSVGNSVQLEGPYGQFDFEDNKPVQIWIGAGVGITPFVARMEHLARERGAGEVYLFHTTADMSEHAFDKMRADAEAAGVTLHITVSGRDARLTAAAIREKVAAWSKASIWFCGPMSFGNALRRDFRATGLAARDFHQERFEMR